jgi:signal peptidase
MSEQQLVSAANRATASGAARTVLPGAAASSLGRLSRPGRSVVAYTLRALLLFITVVVVVLCIGPVTGKYRTLTVLSGSMSPWMKPGDVVVDTPMRAADLKVGDIVTYHLPDGTRRLVTHRIVRIVEVGELPTIQTQGDANNAADPVARLDESRVWRARTVVPKVGYVLNAMRSPKMRILGSVLAPILLLGVWLVRIWGRGSDEDRGDAEPALVGDASIDRAVSLSEVGRS